MIYALPGASFEATLTGAPTGLTGTIGVRILDNAGGTSLARQTTGISGVFKLLNGVLVCDRPPGDAEFAADEVHPAQIGRVNGREVGAVYSLRQSLVDLAAAAEGLAGELGPKKL
jgi:hypothetical protein